uniref:Uncharacterized protein n=1 Tax=Sphaeramia orbicularis TaxID=375764 RepID=A0A673CNS4_9TELE
RSLICTGAEPMCADGGAIVTDHLEYVRAWVSDGKSQMCKSVFVCVKRSISSLLTDRTSVSVMFQKAFQKWTSRFWVMRSNSAPLNSGSMAYFPEVKKELAATPMQGRTDNTMRTKKRREQINLTPLCPGIQ